MLIAFVTEAIGDSITLPVKVLLRTTCDQAARSQSMPLIPSARAADVPDRNSILAPSIGARG
jgi:hypothetical protein